MMKDDTLLTPDYAPRDHEVVEYSNYQLPTLPGILLRGPAVDVENRTDYFSCIGAAQTYGCYVSAPFPDLLTHRLGLQAWNLGVGGGSPEFFLRFPKLIDYVNRGKFAILQVMTGRDSENDRIGPMSQGYRSLDRKRGDYVIPHVIWRRIAEEEPENFEKYLAQSRASWEHHLDLLISKITVPIIHLWFATKRPEQEISPDIQANGVLDAFPNFINGSNLGPIEKRNQKLVFCLSDRNNVFPLRSRFTGKVVEVDYATIGVDHKESENYYYPSAQMHWDAAEMLAEAIESMRLLA